MSCAHSFRKFRSITKIIRVVAITSGGQQRKMFPGTFVCPSGEARNRRFGDDVERSAFAHMPRGAIEPIKQMGAAWTRQLALGPVHEAVQDERFVRTEQLGHLYRLRHTSLADPLEDVVLWYLATGRESTALRCNGLNLCPKRNLIIEKRVSSGTILGAFIGVMKMFHGCGALRRSGICTRSKARAGSVGGRPHVTFMQYRPPELTAPG